MGVCVVVGEGGIRMDIYVGTYVYTCMCVYTRISILQHVIVCVRRWVSK